MGLEVFKQGGGFFVIEQGDFPHAGKYPLPMQRTIATRWGCLVAGGALGVVESLSFLPDYFRILGEFVFV